jgi:hypothetical protein
MAFFACYMFAWAYDEGGKNGEVDKHVISRNSVTELAIRTRLTIPLTDHAVFTSVIAVSICAAMK